MTAGVGVGVAIAAATRCMVEVGVARVGEIPGLTSIVRVGVAMGLAIGVRVAPGLAVGVGVGVTPWLAAGVPATIEIRKRTNTQFSIVNSEKEEMEMHIYIYIYIINPCWLGQMLMKPACINPPLNAPDMIDSISYVGDTSPPFDSLTVPYPWIDMNKK